MILAQAPLHAGILMVGPHTDASGALVPSSDWSFFFNSGTLQANVDPTSPGGGGGTYTEYPLINDWGNTTSGGTLQLITKLIPDGPQDLASGLTYKLDASFTGTGLMDVVARDPWNGAKDGFGGFGFKVASGQVSQLNVDIVFDKAILPRAGVPTNADGSTDYGPFASVTGYKNTGASGSQTNFDMSYELLGTDLLPLNGSLPNPNFLNNIGEFPFPTLTTAESQAKWTTMNANGVVDMPFRFGSDPQGSTFGVSNFNDGNLLDDYVGGIRLILTPADGNTYFDAGTQFNYSIDGDSPIDTQPVPEPSSILLLLSGMFGLLGYRRRS